MKCLDDTLDNPSRQSDEPKPSKVCDEVGWASRLPSRKTMNSLTFCDGVKQGISNHFISAHFRDAFHDTSESLNCIHATHCGNADFACEHIASRKKGGKSSPNSLWGLVISMSMSVTSPLPTKPPASLMLLTVDGQHPYAVPCPTQVCHSKPDSWVRSGRIS